MFFLEPSAVEIIIKDKSKVQSATRVTNYTPYFLENMTFSNGMVGEAGEEDGAVEDILDGLEMSSCGEEEPAADAQESP